MNFYKTGDFLPTYNFFKILETDDFRYMLKLDDYEDLPGGDFDIKVLKETYIDIYSEYLALDKSGGLNTEMFKYKKLSVLKNEYAIVTGYLFILQYYYTGMNIDFENIKKELSNCGYNLQFNNPEELSQEIEKANKRASGILNRINSLATGLNKKNENTDINMYEIISIVEKAYGNAIDIHKTPIFHFVAIKNNCLKLKKNG